jgi:hypothetical protein
LQLIFEALRYAGAGVAGRSRPDQHKHDAGVHFGSPVMVVGQAIGVFHTELRLQLETKQASFADEAYTGTINLFKASADFTAADNSAKL